VSGAEKPNSPFSNGAGGLQMVCAGLVRRLVLLCRTRKHDFDMRSAG
jgi:hypothetical protein